MASVQPRHVLMQPKPSGPRAMLGVTGAFPPLATACVLLRVWVKLKMLRSWGWDDWAIVITLAFYHAECGILISIAMLERTGVESLADREEIALLVPAEQSLYVAGTISLKVSMAIYYLRFLRLPWQRYTILLSASLYTTFALALIGLITFECGVPSRLNLENLFTPGVCVPFHIYSQIAIAHAVFNSLTDFIFTMLPVSVLWKSFLPLPTKISASAIVGLAVLGSVASCVRTSYIPGLEPSQRFYTTSTNALVWTVIEPGLGICAACLCTLRPLFRRCFESAKQSLQSMDTKTTGGRSLMTTVEGTSQDDARSRRGIFVTEHVRNASTRLESHDGRTRPWDEFRKYGFESLEDSERGKRGGMGTMTTILGGAPATTIDSRHDEVEMMDWKDTSRHL